MSLLHQLRKIDTIKVKIAIAFSLCFIIILATFFFLTNNAAERQAIVSARENALNVAHKYGTEVSKIMGSSLNSAQVVSSVFSTTIKSSKRIDFEREEVVSILSEILRSNFAITSISTDWLQNEFDQKDSLFCNIFPYASDGHFSVYLYRNTYGKIVREPLISSERERNEVLRKSKTAKTITVSEPYYFTIGGQEQLVATICSPVFYKEQYIANVSLDVNLDTLQEIAQNIYLYDGQALMNIISNDGILLAVNGKPELIGENIRSLNTDWESQIDNIKNARQVITYTDDGTLELYVPCQIGQTKMFWQIGIGITNDVLNSITAKVRQQILFSGWIGFLLVVLAIILITLYINKIIRPLQSIASHIRNVARGHLDYKEIKTTSYEIFQINMAFKMVASILREKTQVVESITLGDFNKKVKLASPNDLLGRSINKMIDGLIRANEEEELRKSNDEKDNWATRGFALFAELLRQNSDSTESLAKAIIKNLVKYIKGSQGGLFLIEKDTENNEYIRMAFGFAYDRVRKGQVTLNMKEGLIGRCIDEKREIYLTDIPESYISISSGLGDKKPTNLLIIPLLHENMVYGAIEIASFYKFEDYETDFLKKIGANVAATISSVNINMQTKTLLKESREQSDKLSQQEEEMRQNFEEMQATQEESSRKEAEMQSIIETINITLATAEFDLNGNFVGANQKYLDYIGLTRAEVVGKHHSEIINWRLSTDEYKFFWQELRKGEFKEIESKIKDGNKTNWLQETYCPMDNHNTDKIEKILSLGVDISKRKRQEKQLKKQTEMLLKTDKSMKTNIKTLKSLQSEAEEKTAEMSAILRGLQESYFVSEFAPDGKLTYINDKYLEIFNVRGVEIIGNYHQSMTNEDDKSQYPDGYKAFWNDILSGNIREKEYIAALIGNRKIWLTEVYIPIFNRSYEVYKILVVGTDISKTKEQAQILECQAYEMENQAEMSRQMVTKLQQQIQNHENE